LNNTEQQTLDLATKMAMSDPELLGSWKGDDLQETEISLTWAGAYQLFGGTWKGTSIQGNCPPSALKTPKFSGTAALMEPKEPEDPVTEDIGMMKEPVAPKRKGKEKIWKEVTYMKAKLSAC
jgi:hypothetical protein